MDISQGPLSHPCSCSSVSSPDGSRWPLLTLITSLGCQETTQGDISTGPGQSGVACQQLTHLNKGLKGPGIEPRADGEEAPRLGKEQVHRPEAGVSLVFTPGSLSAIGREQRGRRTCRFSGLGRSGGNFHSVWGGSPHGAWLPQQGHALPGLLPAACGLKSSLAPLRAESRDCFYTQLGTKRGLQPVWCVCSGRRVCTHTRTHTGTHTGALVPGWVVCVSGERAAAATTSIKNLSAQREDVFSSGPPTVGSLA